MATIEELQQQVAALSAQVAAITAPPTDYYTSQYDGEEIDAAIGRALPGGEIDASLSNKANQADVDLSLSDKQYFEFLDNTDFTNPVAQAGVGGMHGSIAYALDRWKLISGTVSWSSNGLTLNGTIRQIRENSIGFPVVPSIEMYSGTATITYDDVTKYCDITSSGGTIKRAHLGLIEITDWAKVPMQDRDITLQKCRLYFIKGYKGFGIANDSTFGYTSVHINMRTTPVTNVYSIVDESNVSLTENSLVLHELNQYGACIFYITSGTSEGKRYRYEADLCADL